MRRKKVLIHVDQRTRDAVPMIWLKRSLERRGHAVYLCNRINRNEYFDALMPDVFVQSHIWFDNVDEVKRKARIAKLIVMPTEGAVFNPKTFDDHYGHYQKSNDVFSKVLVWGEAYRKTLVEKGYFDSDRICVVGCPRFDVYRHEHALKKHNATMGFVGCFPVLNRFDKKFIFETIDLFRFGEGVYYDHGLDAEDLYWTIISQFRTYLEMFDEWIIKRNRSCKYRAHPNECRDSYEYLCKKYGERFQLDRGETFCSWLRNTSGLVIAGSSSAVEAMITRMPFIALDDIIGKRLDDHMRLIDFRPPFMHCAFKPTSIKEAVDMMEGICSGEIEAKEVPDNVRLLLREMYDWPRERDSIDDITNEIDALLRNNVKYPVPSFIRSRFKRITGWFRLISQCLWRWVGYIISRTNYEYDRNYHYFFWNFKDSRIAGELLGMSKSSRELRSSAELSVQAEATGR